jgi:hypothetical protein
MSKRAARLIRGPLPSLPGELAPPLRRVVLELEQHLVTGTQDRLLIKAESAQKSILLFVCADRLLRFTRSRQLLLLTGAANRRDLVQEWNKACSLFDGQLLRVRYPTWYTLHDLPPPETRVLIATLREVQWHLQLFSTCIHAVDIVLVDIPTFSPVWKHVLEALPAVLLIGYSQNPTAELLAWFGDHMIDGTCSPTGPASEDAGAAS